MTGTTISKTLYDSYSDCIGTFSEASAGNSGNMIHSDRPVFIFDRVAEKIYGVNKPKSVDALFQEGKRLIAVEFKGGLRDKLVLPDNVIDECEYLKKRGENYHCSDYLKVYKRSRQAEKKENSTAVYAKELDTFLNLSNDLHFTREDGLELWYIAVIDDKSLPDKMDVMVDVLNQEAGRYRKEVQDNDLISLRKSLRNLSQRGKATGNPYLFDRIDVKTASEFEKEYG